MSTNDESANPFNPTRAQGLTASLLTVALAAGCASSAPKAFDPSDIPRGSQLALSPSGQRLLVTWKDSSSKTEARLLTLKDSTVTAMRSLPLPEDTFNVAYGLTEDHVIVTTLDKQLASTLVRIDLKGDQRTVLHSSAARMGFPLEIANDHYMFLEATEPGGRFGKWKRLLGQTKTVLSDQLYSRAAPLSHVKDAVFLLEPTQPPSFHVFQGSLPAPLTKLVDPSTFVIRCADNDPLSCVRTHLLFGPDGQSFATMEIFNGNRRCDVNGKWIDAYEVRLSRDGSTLVFLAAMRDFNGPRGIYVVNNKGGTCAPEQIQIKGSN